MSGSPCRIAGRTAKKDHVCRCGCTITEGQNYLSVTFQVGPWFRPAYLTRVMCSACVAAQDWSDDRRSMTHKATFVVATSRLAAMRANRPAGDALG